MKITGVLLLVLCLSTAVMADYISQRKEATELARTGKTQQALDAWLQLAAGDVSDLQKSDALSEAVILTDRLGQTEQALELAKTIPLEHDAKLAQLRILERRSMRQQAIDQFGDEDLTTWPDRLKGEAMYLRGTVYFFTKHGEKANADLLASLPYINEPNRKGLALNALGHTARTLVIDPDKALAWYQQTIDTPKTGYKACDAAVAMALIYLEKNEPQKAWDALAQIDMKPVTHPYHRGRMLETKAMVLVQLGKSAEAIKLYEEALALANTSEKDKQRWSDAITTIRQNVK